MKRSTKDKLSELPEEILNRILCFLPQKQALRTCELSKSWRRLGSTRTKLEFSRIDDFDGDGRKFTSVVYSTLKRYNRQNLPVHQLALKMNNFDLPIIPFELEFLHELYLRECDLRLLDELHEDNLNILLKRLRNLTLDTVHISNDYLGTILSRCPMLEYLGISNDRKGLTRVSKNDACNLKHFVCSHDCISLDSVVEIDVPTLETIRIVRCPTWRLREDVYFPRLKTVYLEHVRLPCESLGFFSSDYMPSLEELQLHQCYGFREFHLSSPSIKRLHLIQVIMPFKTTIDAPNIVYFKLDVVPLPSISFTPTLSDQWKSIVDLCFFVFDYNIGLSMMRALNKVLKALSQSQITLKVFLDLGSYFHHGIGDSTYGGLYDNKPLDVEHLSLGLRNDYSDFTIPFMLNYMFRVCRPRYIDALAHRRRELTVILKEVLLHERERSDYFWNQDLVEVSIQTYCGATNEWHPVDANSLSESAILDNREFRFGLKWREYS